MIEKLFESLHIPKEIIDAFSGEKLPDNHEDLIENYNKSRIEYFKATPEFKGALENERGETFKGTQRKIIKNLNTEFGLELTNSQIDEIKDFKEFTSKLKSHIETSNKSDGGNEEINKYKQMVTDLRKEKSSLSDVIDSLKVEQETKIKEATDMVKAENYWSTMITKDTELGALNIPGKAFTLDAIKKTIFDTVLIDGEGNVLAKDKTAFVHPTSKKVVTKVDELYSHYKEVGGLIHRSNAGEGGDGKVINPGKNEQDDKFAAALEARLAEGQRQKN